MKNTPLPAWLLLFGFCFFANFSFSQNENFAQRTVACNVSQPWEITYGPDGQIWTTEARGYRLKRIDPTTGASQTILDANSKKNFSAFDFPGPQGGFTGLALHPQLLTGKPFVYLAYVFNRISCGAGCVFQTKIVRYDYNSATQTLSNEQVLVDSIPGSDDHNGGRLAIGQVGGQPFLFYSVGDMGAGQFSNANRAHRAQQTGSYEGKILRFNLEPDADAGLFDRWIPASNPFNLAQKQSAVWSIGHRNPQGLVFGTNGLLYETEHGPYSDDELNIIQSGKNYGFPLIAGLADGNYNGIKVGTGPTVPVINEQATAANLGANYSNPIRSFYPVSQAEATTIFNNQVAGTDPFPNYFLHWPSIAPSGMDFYSSTAIPGWQNSILIASLKRSAIYRLKLSADGQSVTSDTIGYFHGKGRFRDLAISPDGKKIYVACDSVGQTSGPTLGSALVPPNRGCILEFDFQPVVNPCSPDLTPPTVVSCNGTITVGTAGSTATATWVAPVFSDACSSVTLTSNLSSGAAFPVGNTAVVYTARDAANNSSTCSFFISVVQTPPNPCFPDVIAPTFSFCPQSQNLTTTGATAIATWAAPTAVDACGAVTMTSNFSSGAAFPIGATTVVFTARDAANNSRTCTFLINVSQTTAGCAGNVLQNPGFETGNFSGWITQNSFAIQSGGNGGSAFAGSLATNGHRLYETFAATAGKTFTFKAFCKNLAGTASGTLVIKYMSSGYAPLVSEFKNVAATAAFSEFSVTKTAPTGTAFIEISIIKEAGAGILVFDDLCLTEGAQPPNPCSPDVTAPIISSCPANQNLTTSGSSGTATFSNPTAADACSAVTFSSNFQSGAAFPIGTTTVIFTAKDASNNSATCSFLIIVAQNPPPPTGCAGNVVQNNGFENGLAGWGYSQGQVSTVFDAASGSTVLKINESGVQEQLLTVEGFGNAAFSGRFRLTGPALAAPPSNFFDVRVAFYDAAFNYLGYPGNGVFAMPTPSANWQNFSWDVPIPSNVKFAAIKLFFTGSAQNAGFFDDICFAKKAASNPCSPDLTAPTITACPANQNLTTSGTTAVATFSNPTATDNCSAVAFSSNFQSGKAFPIGTSTVVFQAKDDSNNTATCSFLVVVSQSPPPPSGCSNNLLQNTGFENGFSNWDGSGGSISSTAATGTKSLELCTIGHTRRQNLPMIAGKTLTFSFKMRATSPPTARVLTFMTFLSATFQPLLSEFSDIDAGAAFQTFSYSKTAPAGTAWVEIGFVKQTSGCLLTDDVCLSEGSAPPPTGANLQLTLTTPNPNPGQWKNVPITLAVKNTGATAAANVSINFVNQSVPAVSSLLAYSSHSAAAGTTFNSWTGLWTVVSVAAGETKTLLYNGFTRVATAIPVAATSASTNAPTASANLILNGSLLLAGDDRSQSFEAEKGASDVAVFPNPSDGLFEIQLEKWIGEQANLLIFNELGKVVFSKAAFEVATSTLEIDLFDQPSGLYFIKIESEKRRAAMARLAIVKP